MAVLACASIVTSASPIISEFAAANDGSFLDGHGEASDWIELHNPTGVAINLEGWVLRDSANTWTFPPLWLSAGGYSVIFASDKARQPHVDPVGYLHTDFQLDAGGERIALLRPDMSVAWEYAAPGAQKEGVSFGVPQVTSMLSTFESEARTLVPREPVSAGWRTDLDFDDAAWLIGNASAGRGQPFPHNLGIVAYRVHTDTVGGQEYDGAMGMDFVTRRPVIVTELGCFDDRGNGLTRTITTQLWRRDERGSPTDFADDRGRELLASATFTPADPGVLLEGSRFKTLAMPITLAPGAHTIVAFGYGPGEPNGNTGVETPAQLWETQSGDGAIEFVGSSRYGSRNAFPATADTGPANRYAAGTFKFAAPGDLVIRTELPTTPGESPSGAFMRVRFEVADPEAWESLRLLLAFRDGCVAWLNGSEVARRFAPSSLDQHSTATAAGSHLEVIPMNAGLLRKGPNLLALHGLAVSAESADFFIGATLTGIRSETNLTYYFPAPSPGEPNANPGVPGYVADVEFNAERGFYEKPFDLVLTCATPEARIRYTLDGSIPAETNGAPYLDPLRMETTTVVRARAFRQGFEPAQTQTHTYIFAWDTAVQPGSAPPGYPLRWTDYTGGGSYRADYGMINPATQSSSYARAAGNSSYSVDEARAAIRRSLESLPVLSIVTDKENLFSATTGIYLHPGARGEAWERPVSVELITTSGIEDWQADAGIHVMGLTSRSLQVTPKLNFMLVFSADYGDAWLREPFFGIDGPRRIKRIALRSNARDSWISEYHGHGTATYIADGFAKDSVLDSGEPGTRHRYCHVFLNGLYWGVYNPTERPQAHWAETTFGGEDEDYDVVNLCCGNRLERGDLTEWQRLLAASRTGFATSDAYQAIQGNHPDGTRNPALTRLLGIESFIGFAINGYYHASVDWPGNFFVVYDNLADRTEGWRFVTWDTDLGLPNLDVTANKVTPPEGFSHPWWQNSPGVVDVGLRRNPDYRLRFADRVYREFFHGAYTTEANLERWQRLRDTILPGLHAESARWGDYQPGGLRTVQDHWLPRVNGAAATRWFRDRNLTVIRQLRAAGLYPPIDPPTLDPQGGNMAPGSMINLLNPNNSGTIYFTTDGGDPRFGGTDRIYDAPIVINQPTLVRARVLSGSTWSALAEATYQTAQDLSNAQLTEIMFNHPGTDTINGDDLEFIELFNAGSTTLDLGGLSFTDGVEFAFPSGTLLAPGEYCVLVSNPESFAVRYPGVNVHGTYTGRLDNGGEMLRLSDSGGAVLFSVRYDDRAPWPIDADDSGLSLQRSGEAMHDPSDPLAWVSAWPTPGGPPPVNQSDRDSDGLPDGWEIIHAMDPDRPDGDADPDNDGFSNRNEFLAGTDPRDPTDRLQLESLGGVLVPGGPAVVLGFSARSNRTYSVTVSSVAHGFGWTSVARVDAHTTNRYVAITNGPLPSGTTRFFRLTTPRLP
jgi:hypothetical protein